MGCAPGALPTPPKTYVKQPFYTKFAKKAAIMPKYAPFTVKRKLSWAVFKELLVTYLLNFVGKNNRFGWFFRVKTYLNLLKMLYRSTVQKSDMENANFERIFKKTRRESTNQSTVWGHESDVSHNKTTSQKSSVS